MPSSEWLHSMSIFPISVISKKSILATMERSNTLDSAISVEDVTASDAAEVVRITTRPEIVEAVTPRPSEVTGDCDWSEHAAPDTHLWQPSSSGVEVRHHYVHNVGSIMSSQ